MEKLEELAEPLVNWIKENGNPHTQIIVTSDCVRVTEDVLGIPVNNT